jgi:uncharacterized protein YkwD
MGRPSSPDCATSWRRDDEHARPDTLPLMTSRFVPLALVLAAIACTSGSNEPEVPTDVAYCADVVEWDEEWSDFEREVLERVNLYRESGTTCGAVEFAAAEPLVMNESLRCAARVHARDMGIRDYVMHTNPDGAGFADRAAEAEYDAMAVGENLATGVLTPADVVTAWMGREDDCTIIMEPTANELGVGYYATDEATFGSYWVMVSGVRE